MVLTKPDRKEENRGKHLFSKSEQIKTCKTSATAAATKWDAPISLLPSIVGQGFPWGNQVGGGERNAAEEKLKSRLLLRKEFGVLDLVVGKK